MCSYCFSSFSASLVFSFSVQLGWDTVGPQLAAFPCLPLLGAIPDIFKNEGHSDIDSTLVGGHSRYLQD